MRYAALFLLALLGACSFEPDPKVVPEEMAKNQPGDGLVELRRLFAAGHVRAATQADIDAYLSIAKQVRPSGSQPLFVPTLIPDFTLVLLRPFKATPQMGHMTARQIIVPAGVGKNDDPNPLFGYYYMETGRCNVPGSTCLGAPKMDDAWHVRARRISGMDKDKTAMSDDERDSSNWADTRKPKDEHQKPDPLTQLVE